MKSLIARIQYVSPINRLIRLYSIIDVSIESNLDTKQSYATIILVNNL
jgi:hypothetical protein